MARSCGLEIPNTIISTGRKNILEFYKNNYESIVSKSISDSINYLNKGYSYSNFTEALNNDDIEDAKCNFFPSLLQNNINKRFELRIFYFFGLFYTMAIFSQADEKTKIDFRKYNFVRPNRNIPFILPQEIKIKIIDFMNALNLDTGSIDMIYTMDKKYVFLEVNPVGIFNMVSVPCNYKIEKEIANYLINLTKLDSYNE